MSGWIKNIINGMIDAVLNTITSATLAALNWVLNLLNDNVFHSPDMTGLPQVIYLSSRAQLAAYSWICSRPPTAICRAGPPPCRWASTACGCTAP
jgi:hypothetical protein